MGNRAGQRRPPGLHRGDLHGRISCHQQSPDKSALHGGESGHDADGTARVLSEVGRSARYPGKQLTLLQLCTGQLTAQTLRYCCWRYWQSLK